MKFSSNSDPPARLLILYGSETGNSQDLAKIVAWSIWTQQQRKKKEDPKGDLEIEVMSCDEYPLKQLPEEKLCLFICSTTGIGEEPLNMKRFWRFLLRRDLPPDSLSGLRFGVIGLGDSSYLKYNYVAKKLYKRLMNLGATNLLELALGDDQHDLGPFAKIDPWLKQFYKIIFGESQDEQEEESRLEDSEQDVPLIEPSFKLEFLSKSSDRAPNAMMTEPNLTDPLNPYQAKLVRNERLTAEEHFQDVRLASLEIEDTVKYSLGDVCVVYPQNCPEDIDQFLSMFDSIDGQQLFRIEPAQPCWIPQSSLYRHLIARGPCSVRELVCQYLDIRSIPKRSFFDLFYRFSRDQLERDKLKRFASGEDLDELYDYVNRPRRTILEVMLDFRNTTPNVPLHYWFDLIPAISGRPYSVASSPLCSPQTIDLLYAVVNYRTRLRSPRLGLCTNWLVNQPLSRQVSIYIRPSSFHLPEPSTSSRPLILVAAGTGVAPFRALIHDRTQRMLSQNYLFFGCRFSNRDFYLRDEWNPLVSAGLLSLFVAFSRDDPDHKVYVQHLLWQQRQLVYRLFTEEGATILVAGKSEQYPQLVRETLQDIFKDQSQQEQDGDQSPSIGNDKYFEDLINKLELKRRIQFECW